ncbi:MAG: fasciclin domain-containing protein [Planctomycetota bacterium]
MHSTVTAIAAAMLLAPALVAVALPRPQDPARAPRRAAGNDVVAAAAAANFPTLVAAIEAAGLAEALKGEGPFTVFAPTEEAFKALPAGALQSLLQPENKQKLRDVLLLHVVPGRLIDMEVANIEEPQWARTAAGTRLPIAVDRAGFRFGDAKVVDAGLVAGNGVIHAIDRVLTAPPRRTEDGIKMAVKQAAPASLLDALRAVPDGRFSTFLAAVAASGADQDWAQPASQGNWTVFVPTDDAFARLTDAERAALLDPTNRDSLRELLAWHALPELKPWSFEFNDRQRGAVMISQNRDRFVLDVLNNGMVFVYQLRSEQDRARQEKPFKARMLAGDIAVGGNLVHVVDRVLVPRSLEGRLLGSQAYAEREVTALAAEGESRAEAVRLVTEMLAETKDAGAAAAPLHRFGLQMLEFAVPVSRTGVLMMGADDSPAGLRAQLQARAAELDRCWYGAFLANTPPNELAAALPATGAPGAKRTIGVAPTPAPDAPTPAPSAPTPAVVMPTPVEPTDVAPAAPSPARLAGLLAWATVVEKEADPKVVTDPALRSAIAATGLPWRVRDKGTGIELLLVPPGSFLMGASQGDAEAMSGEIPAHPVAITSPYYLGRYEVTESQFRRGLARDPAAAEPPAEAAAPPAGLRIVPRAEARDRDGNVATGSVQVQVRNGEGGIVTVGVGGPTPEPENRATSPVLPAAATWGRCEAFCRATGLRLPTEAEWEYACRAGTQTTRYGELDAIAWHRGNSADQLQAIGTKAANALGLHDMLGNVWEWVGDWYAEYTRNPQTDPKGPDAGVERIMRGGFWNDGTVDCRSSQRYAVTVSEFASRVGLRVARNP